MNGFLDMLHRKNGEVGVPSSFLPGMKLQVWDKEFKFPRGEVIVDEIHVGTARISGNLTFTTPLPAGTKPGDLLLYIASDSIPGLERR
jgi:hypothetical protein